MQPESTAQVNSGAGGPAAASASLPPDAPLSVTNGGLTLIQRLADEIAKKGPGLHTTEFAIVSILLLADVLFGLLGKIPPSLSVVTGLFAAVAYQWLRNNRKDAREDSILTLVETLLNALPSLLAPNALAASPVPGDAQNSNTNPSASGPKVADVPVPSIAQPSPAPIAPPSSTVSGTAGSANVSLLAALAILGVSLFFLAGCTEYDLAKGTGHTWGDSQGFTQTYHGDSIHWDNMSHSAVWDASGRFLGNVSSGVAETLIAHGVAKAVTRGDVNGVQLITATLPPATQKLMSRRTNRVTPTPFPVVPVTQH